MTEPRGESARSERNSGWEFAFLTVSKTGQVYELPTPLARGCLGYGAAKEAL